MATRGLLLTWPAKVTDAGQEFAGQVRPCVIARAYMLVA